jgi:urease gamma subunit
MRLTPTEMDRLLIFTAGQVARTRLARGLALNHPEAVAYICSEIIEAARDGADYDTVVERAKTALRPDQVLDGVPDMLDSISVEAVFADGTKLVQIPRPISNEAPDATR